MPDGQWLMRAWWHAHEIGKMRYVRADSDDGLRWRVTDPERPAVMHPADLELGQNAWVAGLTGASKEEARVALSVLQQYGFTRICFVGRPDAVMQYFRR